MSVFRSAKRLSRLTGFQPKSLIRNLSRFPGYLKAWRVLQRQARASDQKFPVTSLFPILDEGSKAAGTASGHYFHQDLYVAQQIFRRNPERHIDVGSRVDGFVAHVATFREIEVIDVRPMVSRVPNIRFLCADLMAELPPHLVNATDSLSCLHAIEHFGLGRYGDPLNFDGHLLGIRNLHRMLRPGGVLYLSTPVSRQQRIEFNAHRVFSLPGLQEIVQPWFEMTSLSYVDDAGDLHPGVNAETAAARDTFGLRFGCGILELKAKAVAAARAA